MSAIAPSPLAVDHAHRLLQLRQPEGKEGVQSGTCVHRQATAWLSPRPPVEPPTCCSKPRGTKSARRGSPLQLLSLLPSQLRDPPNSSQLHSSSWCTPYPALHQSMSPCQKPTYLVTVTDCRQPVGNKYRSAADRQICQGLHDATFSWATNRQGQVSKQRRLLHDPTKVKRDSSIPCRSPGTNRRCCLASLGHQLQLA